MTIPSAKYPDLLGKRVILTGGASGIGAPITRKFAEQEAKVAFFDIDSAAGNALASELGESVVFYELDLMKDEEIAATVQQACHTIGGVDILVNCAADNTRHKLANVTP